MLGSKNQFILYLLFYFNYKNLMLLKSFDLQWISNDNNEMNKKREIVLP